MSRLKHLAGRGDSTGTSNQGSKEVSLWGCNERGCWEHFYPMPPNISFSLTTLRCHLQSHSFEPWRILDFSGPLWNYKCLLMATWKGWLSSWEYNLLELRPLGRAWERKRARSRWRRKREWSRDAWKGKAPRTIPQACQDSSAHCNQGEVALPPKGFWINSIWELTESSTRYMLGRPCAKASQVSAHLIPTAPPSGCR